MRIYHLFFTLFSCFLLTLNSAFSQTKTLYVGSYTKTDSKGIYEFSFDSKTGILTNKKLSYDVENPTFLLAHPTEKVLYSISKLNKYQKQQSGAVTAFKIGKNGAFIKMSEQTSNGKSPCHLAYDKNTKQLFVSNYQGGTLSIHPTDASGALKKATQIIDFNKSRTKAHTHAAKLNNDALFVADLGINSVSYYTYKNDKFECKQRIPMKKNSGPRHLELTKNGRFIYVVNEYASSITVLERKRNKYKIQQDISTLASTFNERNTAADIHLSKDEKYVYASNRGENSLAIFKRDINTGLLTKIQSTSTHGECPRNFTFDPTGNYLLIANKISNSIAVFKVDKTNGKVLFKYSIHSPMPTCLTFFD
ncbi:MAG: lactonase family protein [Flavicella sp.]